MTIHCDFLSSKTLGLFEILGLMLHLTGLLDAMSYNFLAHP